jgi:hypothetical protein
MAACPTATDNQLVLEEQLDCWHMQPNIVSISWGSWLDCDIANSVPANAKWVPMKRCKSPGAANPAAACRKTADIDVVGAPLDGQEVRCSAELFAAGGITENPAGRIV